MIKFGGLFRQRDFRLLWFGHFISGLGDWILIGALPFHVWSLTGSALIAGTMFMAQMIPSLALGPFVGVFVDRLNRRWTILAADIGRGLIILALLGVRSPESIWIVYVVAALESALSRVAITAKSALIPSIVSKEDLGLANSVWMISTNMHRILGPWLGALLLTNTGLSGVVLTDAVSYFVSGTLLAFLQITLVPMPRRPATAPAVAGATAARGGSALLADWVDGIRFIRGDRVLLAVFACSSLAWMADGTVTALFVVFVGDVLHARAEAFGWLMSARGAGGFAGAFAVAALTAYLSPTRMLPLGLAVAGISLALMVTFPTLTVAVGLLVLAGISAPAWLVGERTILQRSVRAGYRGRVFGWFETFGGLSMLIGMGLGTVSTATFGARPVLLVTALTFVAAGAAALTLLPRELPSLPAETVPPVAAPPPAADAAESALPASTAPAAAGAPAVAPPVAAAADAVPAAARVSAPIAAPGSTPLSAQAATVAAPSSPAAAVAAAPPSSRARTDSPTPVRALPGA